MQSVSAILFGAALLFGPAALVGGITAAIMRSAANRQGLSAPDVSKKAMRGFWIAFAITMAIEIVLFGLCIASVNRSFSGQ